MRFINAILQKMLFPLAIPFEKKQIYLAEILFKMRSVLKFRLGIKFRSPFLGMDVEGEGKASPGHKEKGEEEGGSSLKGRKLMKEGKGRSS